MERFAPVVVNKGRKFRGEAYDIGAQVYTSTFNIWGHGRGGWRSCESVKLWSPDKGWVYANPSYIEEREVDPALVEVDHAKYVDQTITETVDWCRAHAKRDKSEAGVLRFAHDVLCKHHPDMLLAFTEKYNYDQGAHLIDEVHNKVAWALTLGYGNAKSIRIALRALEKKGFTTHPSFVAAWTLELDLRGLGHLVKKYLPEELQKQCI